MDDSSLKELEIILGWTFTKRSLIRQAISASATAALRHRFSSESNKRLAIVGDKVLGLLVSENFYKADATKGNVMRRAVHISVH
jgi:dsRNA-specific ribonuclease